MKCLAKKKVESDKTEKTAAEYNQDNLYLRSKLARLPEYHTINENFDIVMNTWWWTELGKNQDRNLCFGFRVMVDLDQHGFSDPEFAPEPENNMTGRAYRNCNLSQDAYPQGTAHQSHRVYFALDQMEG
jgi:hypothetical protein